MNRLAPLIITSLLNACGEPVMRYARFESGDTDLAIATRPGAPIPPDGEDDVVDEVDSIDVVDTHPGTVADDATIGCEACTFGCCDDHCCALDPSQAAFGDLGDGTIDAEVGDLVFDTGADCQPTSALGACEHVRIDPVSVVCVCRLRSLMVSGHLAIGGPDGLVVLARERILVLPTGTIDVSAMAERPGPGGGWTYREPAAERDGGAGGSFGTLGGGSLELNGTTALEPLTAGATGQGTLLEPTLGGARGGALQLSAGVAIEIHGAVLAHGAGGKGGLAGGGGGGSGGGIIIEAPDLQIVGVVAAHGGGGGGAGGPAGRGDDGRDGSAGAAAIGGAGNDGAGCSEHGFVSGGDGGAGGYANDPGQPGAPGASSDACGPEAWVGSGGGGGGAGRIVLGSLTGCACSGEVSPPPAERIVILR